MLHPQVSVAGLEVCAMVLWNPIRNKLKLHVPSTPPAFDEAATMTMVTVWSLCDGSPETREFGHEALSAAVPNSLAEASRAIGARARSRGLQLALSCGPSSRALKGPLRHRLTHREMLAFCRGRKFDCVVPRATEGRPPAVTRHIHAF